VKCLGITASGNPCKRDADEGFRFCRQHKEKGKDKKEYLEILSGASVVELPKGNGEVTFHSKYPEHRIVLRGRKKIRTDDGQVIEQLGLYAQFRDNQITTRDKEVIEGLRKHPLFGSPELQEF
jgi:hypothetical protein